MSMTTNMLDLACPAGLTYYCYNNSYGNFCLYDLSFHSTMYVPMTSDMHPLVVVIMLQTYGTRLTPDSHTIKLLCI